LFVVVEALFPGYVGREKRQLLVPVDNSYQHGDTVITSKM